MTFILVWFYFSFLIVESQPESTAQTDLQPKRSVHTQFCSPSVAFICFVFLISYRNLNLFVIVCDSFCQLKFLKLVI